MTNTQLINAYLDNELPATERTSFEERLNHDSALKEELDLHKDILEGIRNARRTDLKKRLDNVPVGGAAGWSAGKITTAVAIVAIAALTIYFLSSDTDEPALTDATSAPQVQPMNESETAENVQDNDIIIEEQPKADQDVTEEVPSIIESTENTSEQMEPEVEKQPEVKKPVIAPTFENGESVRKEVTAPDGAILEEVVSGTSDLDVEVERNERNFDFHYVFDNNTLKLYGDFNDDLYEILEFNSNKGKRWFLRFKGKYYNLDSGVEGIQPLNEITDPKLLEVLENIR